jgi:hypothetical protein
MAYFFEVGVRNGKPYCEPAFAFDILFFCQTTFIVFLAAAAGTRVVATDFGFGADAGFFEKIRGIRIVQIVTVSTQAAYHFFCSFFTSAYLALGDGFRLIKLPWIGKNILHGGLARIGALHFFPVVHFSRADLSVGQVFSSSSDSRRINFTSNNPACSLGINPSIIAACSLSHHKPVLPSGSHK